MLDARFQGIAKGVGQAQIIGQIHYIPIKIGKTFLPCTLTVIEGDHELIFGLDMLRMHKASIDLAKNCLLISGEAIAFVAKSGDGQETKIARLIEMGASREAAIAALEAAQGNLEVAADWIAGV